MPVQRRRFVGAVVAMALAVAGGGTLATVPASAAPPDATYTVTIGAKGAWTHPTDTPAASFIDKDGTYYYQQAAALYGATDPRTWDFSSGSDFDTATFSTAISDAVNPANSSDRNNDTTWRCDNSPTGREATAAPAGSGYSQKNFCDLMGVWVDPDTGDWYGLVHNEFTPQPFGDGMHYDAIDYTVSTDQGRTWTIKDHVLTSPYSTERGDTAAFPNQTYYYGDGDPRLFVDIASGYFYVYYNSRVLPKGGSSGSWVSQAHVARAPLSGKMAPSSWRKWYDGSWSQPGVGGRESNMVPVDSPGGTGYTPVAKEYDPANTGTTDQQVAAGTLPPKSDLLTMNIAYDAQLGLYIGEPEVQDQDAGAPQRFYVTDNLATQKWYLAGDSGSYTSGSWYRWFLDPANRTNSMIVGKTFRSYCSFACSNGSDGEYVPVTIGSSAPAVPVDTTRAYRVAGGDGRVLAQVAASSATTSLATPTGSPLESWVFTSDGDGSYTIGNSSTGQLLGVDSTAAAGRAWGAKPTAAAAPAGGPTVGQQWWIIADKSSTTGASTGTYHLVNRYSGLVIGLSADSTRSAETTPARTWSNTTGNAVGGSRAAGEQELTLTATGPVRARDLALNRPTTASTLQSGAYPANLATDGDPATRWSSAFADPQWLQVDLGATHSISEVKLTWEAAYGRAYQIQTSKNGTTWTTVHSTTTGDGGTDDLTGLSGSGRYIRMYGSARGSGYGYSLWSFEVYGK
ncbi:discoidin domain-containing protein [Streptomyces sp. NPDC051976]|uniref:discoidin domain-containing protein n=1 Tax=Streptomyces sp. NPDC051976 TaxID=3154947 RepID=UPI003445943A